MWVSCLKLRVCAMTHHWPLRLTRSYITTEMSATQQYLVYYNVHLCLACRAAEGCSAPHGDDTGPTASTGAAACCAQLLQSANLAAVPPAFPERLSSKMDKLPTSPSYACEKLEAAALDELKCCCVKYLTRTNWRSWQLTLQGSPKD